LEIRVIAVFVNLYFLKPRTMKLGTALSLLAVQQCFAIPRPVVKHHFQTPIEYLKDDPYTREWRDPWDKKVDSAGESLHPLPFRNGKGASILGPQNRDRQKQNPDIIRPPSTDRGDMKNMRWSFADSHVRIEVNPTSFLNIYFIANIMSTGGWLDPPNNDS
jgi:hypothetical protein